MVYLKYVIKGIVTGIDQTPRTINGLAAGTGAGGTTTTTILEPLVTILPLFQTTLLTNLNTKTWITPNFNFIEGLALGIVNQLSTQVNPTTIPQVGLGNITITTAQFNNSLKSNILASIQNEMIKIHWPNNFTWANTPTLSDLISALVTAIQTVSATLYTANTIPIVGIASSTSTSAPVSITNTVGPNTIDNDISTVLSALQSFGIVPPNSPNFNS